MNFLPALFTEAEPADIIISNSTGTYIGRYDRSKFNSELTAEEQPIWSIRFISTPDENTTQTLYPDGSRLFAFVWNNREDYNYKYSL